MVVGDMSVDPHTSLLLGRGSSPQHAVVCTAEEDHDAIGQIDGVHILTLTPETTPEKEDVIESIRFESGEYIDIGSSDKGSAVEILDRSFTGSPVWDCYGTNLESSLARPHLGQRGPVEQVTNLDRAVD